MEYTKGEWYWTRDAKGQPHNLRAGGTDGSKHILFVGDDFMGQYSFEDAEANARLIASAPTMCKELQDILKFITWSMPREENGVIHREMRRAEARITEILAKVEKLDKKI